MMASLFGQRVGVGRDRYHVGLRLLERAPVDVFILDDGFQHLRLGRDLDLLLLGTDESGSLLPAGPFREPRSAARRAQAFIITGQAEPWRKVLRDVPPDKIFTGSLSAVALLTLEGNGRKEYPPSLLDRSKIVAVSAIAKPAAFYRMIQEWEGEIVDALEFPDHHAYSSRDWQLINRAARGVDFIVTTEKDLVKLARFPFAREKLFALRVAMKVENATALLDVVERTIREQVSGTEAG
jgi:tetraacyldisaccharide 4'-kinase